MQCIELLDTKASPRCLTAYRGVLLQPCPCCDRRTWSQGASWPQLWGAWSCCGGWLSLLSASSLAVRCLSLFVLLKTEWNMGIAIRTGHAGVCLSTGGYLYQCAGGLEKQSTGKWGGLGLASVGVGQLPSFEVGGVCFGENWGALNLLVQPHGGRSDAAPKASISFWDLGARGSPLLCSHSWGQAPPWCSSL